MSAALQSLIRPAEAPRRERSARGGVVAFVAIGGGAALAYIVVSALAVGLLPMVESWVVSTLCYAAFVVPVYLLHRRFSFRSEARHSQALPRYLAVQALALCLASAFGYLFHGVMALSSLPAAALVIALTSGVNYLVLKTWAFAFRQPRLAVPA